MKTHKHKPAQARQAHQMSMVTRARRFLKIKRSLGFEMESTGLMLMQFARFADQHCHTGPLKAELILAWAMANKSHTHRYQAARLSVVRCFARHCAAEDARNQVPPARLLATPQLRKQPHIFSDEQIKNLLDAARGLHPVYPLRPIVYATLFGLLACTGLRISEALALTLADVELSTGMLTIRQTKFCKSRLVPLHPTSAAALQAYVKERDPRGNAPRSQPLLIGGNSQALPYRTVLCTFRRLIGVLDYHSNGTIDAVRIHDLRHTFACRRLLEWYRQGANVDHAIALLATYLGHGKVTDTYWYLSGTGELLAIVAKRFEQFAGQAASEGRPS